STAFASEPSMRPRPCSMADCVTSRTRTSKPAFAATSAMPLPIRPQPTTPTVRIANVPLLFVLDDQEILRHAVEMPLHPLPPRGGWRLQRLAGLEPVQDALHLREHLAELPAVDAARPRRRAGPHQPRQ